MSLKKFISFNFLKKIQNKKYFFDYSKNLKGANGFHARIDKILVNFFTYNFFLKTTIYIPKLITIIPWQL